MLDNESCGLGPLQTPSKSLSVGSQLSQEGLKIWNSSFFFFSLFLAAPQHMDLLGQGSDLSHSCNLSHSCGNAGSLTHCARD